MSRCLSRIAYDQTDTDWDAFFRSRQDNDIRWHCPWWPLTEVTTELFGHCVPLAGLHYSSFYTPSRLCRQYGQIQRIVSVLPEFETSRLHSRLLDRISQTWCGRHRLINVVFHSSTVTDDSYKAWVMLQNDEPTAARTRAMMDLYNESRMQYGGPSR